MGYDRANGGWGPRNFIGTITSDALDTGERGGPDPEFLSIELLRKHSPPPREPTIIQYEELTARSKLRSHRFVDGDR